VEASSNGKPGKQIPRSSALDLCMLALRRLRRLGVERKPGAREQDGGSLLKLVPQVGEPIVLEPRGHIEES